MATTPSWVFIIHLGFFLVPLIFPFVLVLTAQAAKFPSLLFPCFIVSSASVITQLVLIVNLTQPGIAWKGNLGEGLSRPGWPVIVL